MSVIYIRDEDGKFIPLPTVKGADYILTEEDKQEIAEIVLNLIPTTEGVEY